MGVGQYGFIYESLEKDGFDCADGGMNNIVPIAEGINLIVTIIDVIVLKTEKPDLKKGLERIF